MRAYFTVRNSSESSCSESSPQPLRGASTGIRICNWCRLPPGFPARSDNDDEFDVRTIYPLLVKRCGRPLSLVQSRTLYRALNEDVSGLFRRPGALA